MQVVFVHGVNTRDGTEYEQTVSCRRDRFNRLAFDKGATIHFPYWGDCGLATTFLRSLPMAKGTVQALGTTTANPDSYPDENTLITAAAKRDFPAMVASLSVSALNEAMLNKSETDRHEIEDFWLAAARYADNRPVPSWLSSLRTPKELGDRIAAEVGALSKIQALGSGKLPKLSNFDPATIIAKKARDIASPYLAQFLGDALMFFARREQSALVRKKISKSLIAAAKSALEDNSPLVLIGHSMGGSVLHELLTDKDSISHFERELGQPLKVDLFLTVGTQVGLFAELKQFTAVHDNAPLGVPVKHYWNIFDFTDTLAFASEHTVPGVIDFEISTTAGLTKAHNAYFDNALFYSRLNSRLREVGLLS